MTNDQNQTLIKELNKLIQVDIDTIHAYSQALEAVENEDIKKELEGFKKDHQRHVDNLSQVVREKGGDPIPFSQDFKGYMIEGYTAIRSLIGETSALKAMETNEKITSSYYKDALSKDFPPEVKEVIQNNFEDEKKHLEFIKKSLTEK
jgi:uncharacterized protein (TIGR02284 family)